MSWWVSIVDADGETCTTEPFEDGGTYVMGGSDRAELNITYNYSPHYYRELDQEQGLSALHEQRAGDWADRLEAAVTTLGTTRDEDYWKATPGNAGAALARLLAWARAYPDARFEVH